MEVIDSISQLLTIYFTPKFATAMVYCTVKPVNYFLLVLIQMKKKKCTMINLKAAGQTLYEYFQISSRV